MNQKKMAAAKEVMELYKAIKSEGIPLMGLDSHKKILFRGEVSPEKVRRAKELVDRFDWDRINQVFREKNQ